ncbi:MAG: hypothetical protein AABX23_03955 [Nanoarchaeota archaeon]
MTVYAKDDDRRLIPRWHWLQSEPARLEQHFGGDQGAGEPDPALAALLEESLVDWVAQKGDVVAGEICSAAILSGRLELARDAAIALKAGSPIESGIYHVAAEVLGQATKGESLGAEGIRVVIGRLRALLRDGARDPIRWTDLSRAFAIIGKLKSAKRAMLVATDLASESRAIVRAASRLLIHVDEADRAHDVLMRSRRIVVDPWVMAAEIAVTNLMGRPSEYAKNARKVIKSGRYGDRDLAELRVALGSQEIWFGNAKLGKRLLRDALVAPTENAIAQVAWFMRREYLALGVFDGDSLGSAEADAWAKRQRKEWADCLLACDRWWSIEPFSSRPSELASYIASTVSGDPDRCVEYARRGLIANPESVVLWNNLAVGYAERGLVRQAVECWRRASALDREDAFRVTLQATRGLIAFREGRYAEGRKLYEDAVALARKEGKLEVMATLHLLREEQRCGGAPTSLLAVAREATKSPDVVVATMATRLLSAEELTRSPGGE